MPNELWLLYYIDIHWCKEIFTELLPCSVTVRIKIPCLVGRNGLVCNEMSAVI
jgi:hypothetical protein